MTNLSLAFVLVSVAANLSKIAEDNDRLLDSNCIENVQVSLTNVFVDAWWINEDNGAATTFRFRFEYDGDSLTYKGRSKIADSKPQFEMIRCPCCGGHYMCGKSVAFPNRVCDSCADKRERGEDMPSDQTYEGLQAENARLLKLLSQHGISA